MSDSTSDDEQLALAIALSLDEEKGHYQAHLDKQQQEIEDRKLALALTLGKSVDELTARDMLALDSASVVIDDDNGNISGAPVGSSSSSIIGAGKKRAADESSSSSNNSKSARKFDRYWQGTIKLTHVRGFSGPTFIRIEDIVQKDHLRRACITAYVYSKDFIHAQYGDIQLVLVTHGKPAQKIPLDTSGRRMVIYPPLKFDYGIFHPKLMLLFYDESLRVVIGSANLVDYDYNELDNVVFIQDFPLLPASAPPSAISDLPAFARDIADLLTRMTVPESVKQSLTKYDFSLAKAHVVASVSGVHQGHGKYDKFGHARMAAVVRSMGPINPQRVLHVEMQTSSLGALDSKYLNQLYTSFQGREPSLTPAQRGTTPPLPPIEVIFPTLDTVNNSRLGQPGAGTIFLATKNWAKATFPRQVMRSAISHRAGTLMHTKYIIATWKKKATSAAQTASTSSKPASPATTSTSSSSSTPSEQGEEVLGYLYVGSHNATAAAWGRISRARDTGEIRNTINNWELGVVLPITRSSEFPTPYIRPAPRYRDDQQPWMQDGMY
ncbi:tyrosyl-DNA phosphodiesterase-domain-containing protein [Gongronella butleri]|nr:tyrosyl-DNA phosphodiesterase-domain-containing protein [Gongronella butleri]